MRFETVELNAVSVVDVCVPQQSESDVTTRLPQLQFCVEGTGLPAERGYAT